MKDKHLPSRGTPETVFPADPDQRLDWSLQDCLDLHEAILFETLGVLTDPRASEKTKQDALAWVQEDLADDEVFSFNVCAKVTGADPDELRALVMATYRQAQSRALRH